MLNKDKIFELMKTSFPKWMDIRKRNKSIGSKYLKSTADEIYNIQNAINDFKKTFFIDSYFGKEEEVITFLYKAHIGEDETNNIQVILPNLAITDSIEAFYNSDDKCYYKNGYLYFKESQVNLNKFTKQNKEISYAINNFSLKAKLNKMHVWNVFDELASFVGIKRHLWEDNKSLEQRILRVNEHKINSTEEGLKNAIINELCVLEPDLKKENIKIEEPCPSNLLKYYNKFETILDYLANINKDVYKNKQWDIDSWSHDINSVDYIPHAWDIFIDKYINGVGFKDDLKVLIANKNNNTNLKISFYKEKIENLKQYIKNKKPNISINLKLKKYNNEIKKNKIKYKITAANVKEISNSNISIQTSVYKNQLEKVLLEDVILDNDLSLKDIEEIDNSILKEKGNYQLEFLPNDNYDYFKIDKCSIINKENTLNLLNKNKDFYFNNEGSLVNKNTKTCIKSCNDLLENDNLINCDNGFKLNNLTNSGTGIINIDNCNKDKIYIFHDSEELPLDNNYISTNNFILQDNVYRSVDTTDKKVLEIKGEFNEISFDLDGSYNINYTIDGEDGGEFNNGKFKFSTNKNFSIPQKMNIKITCTGSKLTISNIKYKKYYIAMFDNKNNIVENVTPDCSTLQLKIKTYTGFSPVIKKIYIGESTYGQKYTTEIIQKNDNEASKLFVRTNSNINLIKNGEVSIRNYEPYKSYKAKNNNSYIKLNLSNYNNIINIKTDVGRLEQNNNDYYIFLKQDNKINKITINGTYEKIIAKNTLAELFKTKTSQNDKIYVSQLINGFVIDKNNNQEIKHIDLQSLNIQNNTRIKITCPEDTIAKFIINKELKKSVIANEYAGIFEEVLILPKNNNEYIAYNSEQVFFETVNDIDIVNNFSPLLPESNENMAYKIISLDDNSTIKFQENNKEISLLKDWTIGRKNIVIQTKKDLNNSSIYSSEINNIAQRVNLSDVIKLDTDIFLDNKKVDLTNYMLSTDNGEIVYKTRTKTIPLNNSIIKEPEFYFEEKIIVEKDMFNKLKKSNIDDIIYIGNNEWKDENSLSNISEYSILKNEGIITWTNKNLIGKTVHILYSIKVPDYIKLDLNLLYKKIDYSIEAYELLGEKTYHNLNDKEFIDISKDYLYNNCTKIMLECSSPGFDAYIKDGIIRIKFIAKENELAIKTGYYYDNGDEYYLFNNQDKYDNKIDNNDTVKFCNVKKEDGEMIFTKSSKNLISNSLMIKDYMSETFYKNFKRSQEKGISSFNSLTACDNFNEWNTLGMELELVDGLNGVGIQFNNSLENGYAYINITKYIDSSHPFISLYCDGPKVFVGKQIKYKNFDFTKSNAIKIFKSFNSPFKNDFFECDFLKEEDFEYYLIVTRCGIVDDIIICDNINQNKINLHQKNINKLGLKVKEKEAGSYTRKILFESSNGAKCNGAELDKDKRIVNSSHLDWGLTNIKNISCKEDYEKCKMERLDISNNLIVSKEKGAIITDPTPIEKEKILNLIIKINNIMFENMKNFNITVLGCSTMYGIYTPLMETKDNIFEIPKSLLTSFIKLKIEIPQNKVIQSIDFFANYYSSANNAPKTYYYNNGEFLTKVLDTQVNLDYKIANINIDSISNTNDVDIFIRASRDDNSYWMQWKQIKINQDLKINNTITFDNCRFFQAKIKLKTRNAYIKISSIDIEVM